MGTFIQFAAMHEKANTYLNDLLAGVPCQITAGAGNIQITGLTADSREVQAGNLFFAVPGHAADGHHFIPAALSQGCAAVVVEKGRFVSCSASAVPIIEVTDVRKTIGLIAANLYGHPASRLKLIGITGTNGKTTTAYLVEAMIKAGGRPGVIGTVNYRYQDRLGNDVVMEAPLTTPDPITLQRLLRQMADDGVTHVVMEVSSHALAQGRLHGLQFDVAAFTNLSRDHLDFHHDMTKYFDSKKQLFLRHMSPSGKIVIGLNSPAKGRTAPGDADWGEKLCDALSIGCGPQVQQAAPTERQSNDTLPPVATCGLDRHADIHPHSFAYDLDGIRAQVNTPAGTIRIRSPLVGDFNMKNLLTSIGIGLQLGFDPEMIGQALNAVANIPGRLERITSRCGAYIFVDYAHTPDALENVLTTLQRLQPLRLICVFGCGGDRDSGKRPLMGEIAGRLCDVVLVTSDNPRSEDPETIIQEIEDGLAHSALIRIPAGILMQHSHQRGYDCLISRQQAIKTAVQHARAGEVVLIAGKGHECYQLTSTGRHFFDDRIEAGKYVNGDALC